jgi:site-specific recombinase XerD
MMDKASRVRVGRPLAFFAAGFREELVGRGYAVSSAATHLVLMAQLSGWLDAAGLDLADLTAQRVDDFLCANRAIGHRFPRSADGLTPLLAYLRRVGGVPPVSAPVRTASEDLVERFGVYLVRERGLTAGTIVGYRHAATLFLAALDDGGVDLERLTESDVNGFLVAECARHNVAGAKNLVTGLRSLLRFFHVEGITAASLSGAVPTVAGWSGSSLPRGIDSGSVKRLLGGCDRRTTKGRRDFAILMLLTRLGMRAGEVTALELGDIDWRGGKITVRGKGNRLECLPLPVDVGNALAGYARRGRPRNEHREFFLRVLAPHRGLTVGAINVIVHAACDRARLPSIGTHRLRHTVASELLRRGAGLGEIGQLLRHRSIASTAIYARVDTAALSQLARPWPGGAA